MTEQARIYGKVLYELQIPEDMVQETGRIFKENPQLTTLLNDPTVQQSASARGCEWTFHAHSVRNISTKQPPCVSTGLLREPYAIPGGTNKYEPKSLKNFRIYKDHHTAGIPCGFPAGKIPLPGSCSIFRSGRGTYLAGADHRCS